MAALVTLAEAKDQLNIQHTEKDAEIQRKAEMASAIILNYIKDPTNSNDWDDETTPDDIKASILMQLGELFRFRGDDEDAYMQGLKDSAAFGRLSPNVSRFVYHRRTPTLA